MPLPPGIFSGIVTSRPAVSCKPPRSIPEGPNTRLRRRPGRRARPRSREDGPAGSCFRRALTPVGVQSGGRGRLCPARMALLDSVGLLWLSHGVESFCRQTAHNPPAPQTNAGRNEPGVTPLTTPPPEDTEGPSSGVRGGPRAGRSGDNPRPWARWTWRRHKGQVSPVARSGSWRTSSGVPVNRLEYLADRAATTVARWSGGTGRSLADFSARTGRPGDDRGPGGPGGPGDFLGPGGPRRQPRPLAPATSAVPPGTTAGTRVWGFPPRPTFLA